MGTHHILKDGTSYAISGGTDLIAGTSYQIWGGRTLVNGTVYEIGFAKNLTVKVTGEFYEPDGGYKGGVKIAGTNVPIGEYQVESGAQIEVRAGYVYAARVMAAIYLNEKLVASGELNKYTFNATNDTKINFIVRNRANTVYITTE